MRTSDDTFEGLVNRVDQAPTSIDLQKITFDFFKSLGATSIIYHLLPPIGATPMDPARSIHSWGFPMEWARKYTKERYFEHNPIIRKGRSKNQAFLWSDIRNENNLTEDEEIFLREMDEANLGDGIAIPTYGPNGYNGSLAFGLALDSVQLTQTQILLAQIIAQLAHQRHCLIIRFVGEKKISFSNQERQVIHWMALGKSNSVIADILDISQHTVDTYARRIYEKLDVSDRLSATLRGMSRGILH